MEFVTIPVTTWLVCGTLKFVNNLLRYGRDAFKLIGHGGFPSNHTAIISSVLWMFVFTRAWSMAALAMAVLMIHVFDATGLRRQLGRHASAINGLTGLQLREVTGHNVWDITGGLAVGFVIASIYFSLGTAG
jgi:acid phosphatase family membrane protein YuiD